MNRVLTIGTFDLLHPGHLQLFRTCRRVAGSGGLVIVAVNTDAFVAQFKPPPVMNEDERVMMVDALHGVDLTLHNLTAGADTIRMVRPTHLVVGDDWQPRERYLRQINFSDEELEALGIDLVYSARTTGCSSTALKERILSR